MSTSSDQQRVHGGARVHPTAIIEDGVALGAGTQVWAHSQIRSGARIGCACVIGRNCFVGRGVVVGDRVKIQNNASLYEGLVVEDGAFIGPHVVFTNDRVPRAVNPDGVPKTTDDWELGRTLLQHGAALGAGTVVVTGVTIGRWAMAGAGSVITHDVPDHALVLGNPARVVGWVSAGGSRCDTQAEAIAASAQEGAASAVRLG